MSIPKDILVKKDSLFIRFFMWVWDFEEDNLDQCRVFWGLMFFPCGFLFREKRRASRDYGLFLLGLSFYLLMVSLFALLLGKQTPWAIMFTYFILGLGFIAVDYFPTVVTIKKSDNAEKILNKITITGSIVLRKILSFLRLIFYVPVKIIIFFTKPIWKLLIRLFPGIKRLWHKIIDAEKTKGFFRFIVTYIMDYKQNHCRKIKLK